MLLRLGNATIADSDTDYVTQTLSVSVDGLSLSNDSIGIIGSKWARQIAREGSKLSVAVTVGRTFKDYHLAERFTMKHMGELNGMTEGYLRIKTMLGDVFAYENAVLEGASVVGNTGVWSEISYSFTCGSPCTKFVCSIRGYAVSIGGYHITISA